jgi:hypothetical protein
VILKADEESLVHPNDEITNRATLPAVRHHINEAQSFVFVVALDGKARAENLKSRADREDVTSVADP